MRNKIFCFMHSKINLCVCLSAEQMGSQSLKRPSKHALQGQ
ncbi:unnamed protein product [Ixodes persulcatus]